MRTIEQALEEESIAISSVAIWTKEGDTVSLHPQCGGTYTGSDPDTSKAIDKARIAFRESIIERISSKEEGLDGTSEGI